MMTGSPNAAQRLRAFVSRSRLDREPAAGGDPTEARSALRASQPVTPKSRLGLAASLQNVLDAAGEPARG